MKSFEEEMGQFSLFFAHQGGNLRVRLGNLYQRESSECLADILFLHKVAYFINICNVLCRNCKNKDFYNLNYVIQVKKELIDFVNSAEYKEAKQTKVFACNIQGEAELFKDGRYRESLKVLELLDFIIKEFE